MRKLALVLILAAGALFTEAAAAEPQTPDEVAIAEASEIYVFPDQPTEPPPIDPNWPPDRCFWNPDAPECPGPCTIGCGTSCYTCLSIPPGPDGEPASFHCDTNSNGGYTSCSAEDNGCTVYGMCGSWQ